MIWRTFALTGLALLALVFAGCGRRGRAEEPASASPVPPAVSVGTTGCGQTRTPASTVESIDSGRIKRSYRLYLPKGYDGSRPVPLVLNFHGFTSNARQQETYSHMTSQADAGGFITVAADGTGSPQRWYIYGRSEAGYVDDIAFVSDLIDHLEATLCIDPARVYSTGMSNGAGLSDELACELNGRLAAIAPVAGLAYMAPRCDRKGPMPVIAFHGTEDQLVPFEGGAGGRLGLSLKGIRDNAKSWAAHNGCKTGPTVDRVAEDVTRESYTDCNQEADVVLYVVEGGGHTWPGAKSPGGNGKITQSIDATALIWDFFQAHPKPGR